MREQGILVLVLGTLGRLTGVAHASPLGTFYAASVTSLPGNASRPLGLDALESPFGSSGQRVREESTSYSLEALLGFAVALCVMGQAQGMISDSGLAITNAVRTRTEPSGIGLRRIDTVGTASELACTSRLDWVGCVGTHRTGLPGMWTRCFDR